MRFLPAFLSTLALLSAGCSSHPPHQASNAQAPKDVASRPAGVESAPLERALASLAPPDAEVFVELTSLEQLMRQFGPILGLPPEVNAELATALGVPEGEVDALIDQIEGAALAFARRAQEGGPGIAGDAIYSAARAQLGGDPGLVARLRMDALAADLPYLSPYFRRGSTGIWLTRISPGQGLRSSFEVHLPGPWSARGPR